LKDDSVTGRTKLELVKRFDYVFDIELIKVKEVSSELEGYIKEKIAERKEAKKNKDFELADKIRDDLLQKGVKLIDGRDGTTFEII